MLVAKEEMTERQELYPKHIIAQALQSNILATINMAGFDADPEILQARLGVICELAELFGLSDQLRVPYVPKLLIKAKANSVFSFLVAR